MTGYRSRAAKQSKELNVALLLATGAMAACPRVTRLRRLFRYIIPKLLRSPTADPLPGAVVAKDLCDQPVRHDLHVSGSWSDWRE